MFWIFELKKKITLNIFSFSAVSKFDPQADNNISIINKFLISDEHVQNKLLCSVNFFVVGLVAHVIYVEVETIVILLQKYKLVDIWLVIVINSDYK